MSDRMKWGAAAITAAVTSAAQGSGEMWPIIGTSADPAVWKSTAVEPDLGWNTDFEFDDSEWGPPVELITWGGVTSEFAVPVWDHAPASCSSAAQFTWLRAQFTLDSMPDYAVLNVHADDDSRIYINGELVLDDHSCNANYIEGVDVRAALVVGTNLIAIEADDCFGGCHGIIAWIMAEVVSHADIHYVDDDNCPGPGDGSESDPYCSIQTAIGKATDADQIIVAPGTYLETIDFLGKAVTLRSSDGPEVTIIDGAGNDHVVQCVSGEGPDTVLDGFTITGGNANGPPNSDDSGGGMLNEHSSPTVINCTFSGNAAFRGGGISNFFSSPTISGCTFEGNSGGSVGGGMANRQNSNPTVTDCTFSGNSAPGLAGGGGGGMFNWDNSNPTVRNCTFIGNEAEWGGGGMLNTQASPTVTDCTFSGNHCEFKGGGVFNWNSSPIVTNCTFIDNTASHGGGMYNWSECSPMVINCTFSGNSASGGGGMRVQHDCHPIVINCTFYGNEAQFGRALACNSSSNEHPSELEMANCIIWGGINQIENGDESTINITYSDVQGGWPGAGNVGVVPMCVDPASGDLRLSPDSPCIDAGDNTAVPEGVDTDLDGNPRFLGIPEIPDTGYGDPPIVDMGAYESFGGGCLAITRQEVVCRDDDSGFTVTAEGLNACTGGTTTVTFTGTGGAVGEDFCATLIVNTEQGGYCCSTQLCVPVPQCPPSPPCFDITGDDIINVSDFLTVLSDWGACVTCTYCPSDLDANCEVGVGDFLVLLANWGPCP